jgi:PKD repeat protein
VFDGSSSKSTNGTIVSFQWKFGDDGSTASGQSVQHTFTSGGDFSVTLTASDNKGGSNSTAQVVHVTAVILAPPTIIPSPTSASSGQQVFFTSTTTVGSNGHAIVAYNWNFGDGTTGSGQSVSHAFAANGVYTVLLTITDDQGHTATGTQTITVGSGSGSSSGTIQANFTASPPTPSGPTGSDVLVLLDGSSSTPSSGATIVSYVWTFQSGSPATGQQTSRTFKAGAKYSITLTVVDSNGQTATLTQILTVTGT